jgi:hypothetical protein
MMGQRADMAGSKDKKGVRLTPVLEEALSQESARKRRNSVFGRDKRTETMIHGSFEELDNLVQLLLHFKNNDVPAQPDVPIDEDVPALETDVSLEEEIPFSDSEPVAFAPAEETEQSMSIEDDQDEDDAVFDPDDPVISANLHRLLDDVSWLYGIKDLEGMLISLERLVTLSPINGDLKEFIDSNESNLRNIFESYLGPMEKEITPTHVEDGVIAQAFRMTPKVATLFELVGDGITVQELIDRAPYHPVETFCVLSQLKRTGLLSLQTEGASPGEEVHAPVPSDELLDDSYM